MQSGRPSESSSRHRWGKYNSGIGSPKVASGSLLSEVFGSLPLEMWICHISSCRRGKESQASSLFFLSAQTELSAKDFLARLLFNSRICAASVCSGAYMLVGLLVCLCVCASTRVGVLLSYLAGWCLRGCFIRALVGRWFCEGR